MGYRRRELIGLFVAFFSTYISGCVFAPSESPGYIPIVVENQSSQSHITTISITSAPSEGGGYTKYFCDATHLSPSETEEFSDGVTVPDFEPNVIAIVALENENSKSDTFRISSSLREIIITINSKEKIQVNPVSN